MKTRYLFELEYIDSPIDENNVCRDNEIGGVKTVYKVHDQYYITIKFGWKEINIPILRGKHREVIYFRPMKKHWDTKRNFLPHNFWGKKNHPLTNAVLQLSKDFQNIDDECKVLSIEKHYDEIDTQLCKLIRRETESFVFHKNQNLI
jgi:hypothetical protein